MPDINVFTFSCQAKTFLSYSWLVKKSFCKELDDDQSKIQSIKNIISDNDIELVFPVSEAGFKLISRYKNELERLCNLIPIPEINSLETVLDKYKFSQFLFDHQG